jgi:hypothetical protein
VIVSGLNDAKVVRLAHLQLIKFGPLSTLEIPKPGDKFNHFLTFKRSVVVTLDVVLVADFTDEFFAFGDATVVCLKNVLKNAI